MVPSELPSSPPEGLFFAGSDEENDDVVMESTAPSTPYTSSHPPSPVVPHSPNTSSPRSSPIPQPLFLQDSDDEDQKYSMISEEEQNAPNPVQATSKQDSDVELIAEPHQPIKREQNKRPLSLNNSQKAKPSKKPRLSPAPSPNNKLAEGFVPPYLGELVIANAWSNVSGKGYVKPNDVVLVQRDEDEENTSQKADLKKKNPAPVKKQATLTSMLKQPAKSAPKKRKNEHIVRLVNLRGFEFGRLPMESSWWIWKLLELGFIRIRAVMTDCPEKLRTGASLIVTLHIYLLEAAFKPLRSNGDSSEYQSSIRFNLQEGLETGEESSLRERKQAIVHLFNVVGLEPQGGANVKGKGPDPAFYGEALKSIKSKKVKEIVGDGEEIEVDDAENLSKNDLDTIYERAQHHDQTMGEMEPNETFALTLRTYQKQALFWMHSLETGSLDAREASSMHPLWAVYTFPPEPTEDGIIDLTAEEKPFYSNPYSGELSLNFPKAERNCRGGILADEMGMGKTIMLSALIQTALPSQEEDVNQEEASHPTKPKQLRINNNFRVDSRKPSVRRPPSGTLVVAPTSLINQWGEELARSSKPGTLSITVWHGQNRLDIDAIVSDDDVEGQDKPLIVVITSYGILASEHAKMDRNSRSKSPIFDIEWFRVILDEAHSCKSRTSKTAKAVYDLSARRKWAVTGTPIVNRLEDLYSLIKFLQFKPWSEFAFFRSFITVPFLARDPKAIEVVQIILESILLRREKNMRDSDGRKIVELPPKEVKIEQLEFTPLERKIYDSIYYSAKRDFEQLDAKGLVSKNYTHILAMLMRLRRAVLHPSLVLTRDDQRALSPTDERVDVNDLLQKFTAGEGFSSGQPTAFAQNFIANLKGDDNIDCPICFNEMETPVVIPDCMHQFCKDCITSHIGICEQRKQVPVCPTCSIGPLKSTNLIEIVREDSNFVGSQDPAEPEVVLRKSNFQSSTKLDALIQNLRKLRDQDPCFRAVVFSQFTSFLDLVDIVLERERFDHYRFDGTMDIKKKSAAISEFKSASRKPKVLVVSLKAGGVGLNLTTANHVFMMDCWWNAAVEHQAIDRVHRIGQEKTVYVTHFIVDRTIENRVLRIQKRKTAIINEAFKGSGKADPDSIQNLKIMFGDEE